VDSWGKNIPKLLGTSQDLERVVREHGADELIIARKGMSSDDILEMTSKCRELRIQFKIIPQIYGYFIENLTLQDIAAFPLSAKGWCRSGFRYACQRIMDLALSFLVCLFFAPVFILISILIRGIPRGP